MSSELSRRSFVGGVLVAPVVAALVPSVATGVARSTSIYAILEPHEVVLVSSWNAGRVTSCGKVVMLKQVIEADAPPAGEF